MSNNPKDIIVWGTGDAARKALTPVEVYFGRPVRYITSTTETTGAKSPFGLTFVSKSALKMIVDGVLVVCSSAYLEIIKEILDRGLFDPDLIYIYGDHVLSVTGASGEHAEGETLVRSSQRVSAWDIPTESSGPMSPLRPLKRLSLPEFPIPKKKLSSEGSKGTTSNLHLFYPYYRSSDPPRQAEIDRCLFYNLANTAFERITVIADGSVPNAIREDYNNVAIIEVSGRLSYADWFRFAIEIDFQGIILLCNADIFFDKTISILDELFYVHGEDRPAIVVSRYDAIGRHAILHTCPHYSQDVWAFHSSDLHKVRIDEVKDLYLGSKRCDSKLAFRLADWGFRLFNPCHFIHAFHLHESGQRNYSNNFNYDNLGANVYVYPMAKLEAGSFLEYAYYQRAPYYVARSRIVNWY